MTKKFLHDRIHDIDSAIEFQHKSREIVGIVKEIEFNKDEYQKRLWYRVLCENGDEHRVDGELFQTF